MSDVLGPPTASERVFDGEVLSLRVSQYRRPSGLVVRREVIDHPGAVMIIPIEDGQVLLVRQPREAVEQRLLELPAGKLDVPGEPPLECAKRELAEEVGRGAKRWEDLGGFYATPAISTEFIHCFLAVDLFPVLTAPVDDEEIEVVPVDLESLDQTIALVQDAKTLIGLMRLARRMAAER